MKHMKTCHEREKLLNGSGGINVSCPGIFLIRPRFPAWGAIQTCACNKGQQTSSLEGLPATGQ